MARKNSSTILQEELYPQASEPTRQELDDACLPDLDVEQESPFLRAQKRVSVRRGSLPRKTATRLTWVALAAVLIFFAAIAAAGLYRYGKESWRFRVESSDDIEIGGLSNVTRSQVIEVMGGDIGRNLFFVPLAQRKKQLEQIPWVESASVMRFVPNRLRIEIHERTPVAFARVGSRIFLVDAAGVLMDLPVTNRKKFSFPVILGMNLGEPLSTRAARMKLYSELVRELDSGGGRYSQNLSEVDLSDPDDVKVLAGDAGGEVLVHLGSDNFLDRFKIYVSHVQEWRRQFARLDSVDLRYEHQIVVNPDLPPAVNAPPLSTNAIRAATAAGVKPVALVSHELPAAKPNGATKPVAAAVKPAVKSAAAKKKAARARRRKLVLKRASAKAKGSSAATNGTPPAKPASGNAAPKTSVTASDSNAAKPGSKPSPAIPKGQGQQ